MKRIFAVALVIMLAVGAAHSQSRPKPKPAEKSPEKSYTSQDIERRVTAALEWFCDHQGPEGQFSAKHFAGHTLRKRAKQTRNIAWVSPGEAAGDEGLEHNADVPWTALALLCFAGSGHDHTQGVYKEYVAKGLGWLRKQQQSNGCIGEGKCSSVHDHAVATMALCELYALSGDAELQPAAQKATEYLLSAQNPGAAWRYGHADGDNDTQMTAWCGMALKTAQLAGLEGDFAKAWEGVNKYLDSASGEIQGVHRTGYTPGTAGGGSPRSRQTGDWVQHPCMDSVNIALRLFSGDKKWSAKNKDLKSQAGLLNKDLPAWDNKKVCLQYLYFGTLAQYQLGEKKDFEAWKNALLKGLLENQRGWHEKDPDTFEAVLDEFGSWDNVDAWYTWGGRVWSTAMSTLSLQVILRYMRMN